jgi:hypothetical protein
LYIYINLRNNENKIKEKIIWVYCKRYFESSYYKFILSTYVQIGYFEKEKLKFSFSRKFHKPIIMVIIKILGMISFFSITNVNHNC